jgi:AcrR family transcriptional regulator
MLTQVEPSKMTRTKLMPGRPRSDSSQAALIDATFALLREVGYERLTMDAIANRAGVGKTTIYRWYETKEELVIEAISSNCQAGEEFSVDTGSLASDLQAIIQHRLDSDPLHFNRQSTALTISALAGSQALAKTYWDNYITKKRDAYKEVFERAKKRGELAPDADVDLFLDLVHGYLLFGLLVRPKGTVSAQSIGKAVKRLLAGCTPRD